MNPAAETTHHGLSKTARPQARPLRGHTPASPHRRLRSSRTTSTSHSSFARSPRMRILLTATASQWGFLCAVETANAVVPREPTLLEIENARFNHGRREGMVRQISVSVCGSELDRESGSDYYYDSEAEDEKMEHPLGIGECWRRATRGRWRFCSGGGSNGDGEVLGLMHWGCVSYFSKAGSV